MPPTHTIDALDQPTPNIRTLNSRSHCLTILDTFRYYTSDPREAIREVIANTFVLIRDFIKTELGEEPDNVLGEQYWRLMLAESEVFQRERENCLQALRELPWPTARLESLVESIHCISCDSELVMPDEARTTPLTERYFTCRACRFDMQYTETIEAALGALFVDTADNQEPDNYSSLLSRCSECGRVSYVEEDVQCVLCGNVRATA